MENGKTALEMDTRMANILLGFYTSVSMRMQEIEKTLVDIYALHHAIQEGIANLGRLNSYLSMALERIKKKVEFMSQSDNAEGERESKGLRVGKKLWELRTAKRELDTLKKQMEEQAKNATQEETNEMSLEITRLQNELAGLKMVPNSSHTVNDDDRKCIMLEAELEAKRRVVLVLEQKLHDFEAQNHNLRVDIKQNDAEIQAHMETMRRKNDELLRAKKEIEGIMEGEIPQVTAGRAAA